MAYGDQGQIVPNAPATGWEVTAQQETFATGPAGRVEKVVRVMFTTGKGTTASVDVPMNQYNPANVRAAVAAYAAQLDEVHGLKG